MEFKYESNRIYIENDEKVIAEITYLIEDNKAIINHTFVDDSLRGQGIAGQLVERAVNKIREEGYQVAATCPYAVKWLEKNA